MGEGGRFERAVERVLAHEGGYVHDPRDPGGETKFGISKRSYPALDIAGLAREQAVALYRRDFWQRYGYGELADEALAARVFDLAVNCGPARAHRMLQRAVNRLLVAAPGGFVAKPAEGAPSVAPAARPRPVAEDGVLGPATRAAVNGYRHPRALTMALKLEAGLYYAGLNRPEYLAGWLARLEA